MSAFPVATVSRTEYLRRERLAEFRSEYHRGQIVAMSGASLVHNEIAGNINTALRVQLRDRPCSSYASDLRVSVQGGERYVYPDIVATCGEKILEDDEFDSLVNPVLIMEILSPSTEAYDRGEKFLHYQAIPSLREYVLVSQERRRFEVYRRQPDGSWSYQSWPPAPQPMVLQSIDCTLSFDEVYHKVEGLGRSRARFARQGGSLVP